METIHQEYLIKASPNDVFNALVNPLLIERWSGAPAKMDENEGSRFELWGGDIYGTNIEVVPNKRLVQNWYGGDWEEPSKVTLNIIQNEHGTAIQLIHENVPENEFKSIDDGWRKYYLGPIQEMFSSSE